MSESVRDMLAREAVEAEARAEAEDRGEVAPAPGQRGRKRAQDPSQVYAVRIPVSRLQELRRVADQLDTPPSTLIRQWVLERLDELAAHEMEDSEDVEVEIKINGLTGKVKLGRRRQRDSISPMGQPCGGLVQRA